MTALARSGERLPDALADLAAVARAEHDAFERDARSAIAHAIRAGEALHGGEGEGGPRRVVAVAGGELPGHRTDGA